MALPLLHVIRTHVLLRLRRVRDRAAAGDFFLVRGVVEARGCPDRVALAEEPQPLFFLLRSSLRSGEQASLTFAPCLVERGHVRARRAVVAEEPCAVGALLDAEGVAVGVEALHVAAQLGRWLGVLRLNGPGSGDDVEHAPTTVPDRERDAHDQLQEAVHQLASRAEHQQHESESRPDVPDHVLVVELGVGPGCPVAKGGTRCGGLVRGEEEREDDPHHDRGVDPRVGVEARRQFQGGRTVVGNLLPHDVRFGLVGRGVAVG